MSPQWMDPILAHIHLSFHSSQNLPVPFGALVAGFIGTGDLAITKYTVVFIEKGDFSVMGGLCSHQRRSALVRKQLRKRGFTFCFQVPKARNETIYVMRFFFYFAFNYIFSLSSTEKITSREALFSLIAKLFQCTRVAISAEPNPVNGHYYFHSLLELYPGVLWKNVDAHFRTKIAEFTLVPLHSFNMGFKSVNIGF